MATSLSLSQVGDPPQHLKTLVEVARWRAELHPEETAFTFLVDGELSEQNLTFGQLDRRARNLAAQLMRRGASRQPVLLMFEPGLEYIVGFFGCLYAGAAPVPVYPPDPMRLSKTLPRLAAIVRDAGTRLALGTEQLLAWSATALNEQCGLQSLAIEEGAAESQAVLPTLQPEELAFLQYTSGSTGDPKGVILSHGNVLSNLQGMAPLDRGCAVACSWLPPYHDMGLVGGVLLPVYCGRRMVLMSPLSFVQRPLRWLQAITRYQANTSPAPNFGYDLCVRKVSPEEKAELDLRCWTLALNGAEPVRLETIDRFVEAFECCGFRREAFYPCYGMAEATLMATGGPKYRLPVVKQFSAAALEANRAIEPQSPEDSRPLVSSGQIIPEHQLAIVDPLTCRELPPGQVGEIWLRGPSIGQGYWNRPAETAATFQAEIADRPGKRFLRTGDLGFLDLGELFVAGRAKEMLILRGRNFYPHDLEQVAERAHPLLKPDGALAFSIEQDGEEQLVLVHEVQRPKKANLDEVALAIARELAAEAGVAPQTVVLVSCGSLPKTTSGKRQRNACRAAWLQGELDALHVWQAAARDADRAIVPPQNPLEAQLVELWSEALGVVPVGRDDDFFCLGGQSLAAAQLLGRIYQTLHVHATFAQLLRAATPALLALELRPLLAAGARNGIAQKLAHAPRTGPQPLSSAQRRLWFLDRWSPGNQHAHVPVQIQFRGPLDAPRLLAALRAVILRHDVLRCTFGEVDGEPVQTVLAEPRLEWSVHELGAGPADAQRCEELLAQAAQAPFDLQRGPLLRAQLLRRPGDQATLQLVLHHLICDGRSIELLLSEVKEAYAGRALGDAGDGPQFIDYVHWQRDRLSSAVHERHLAYWRKALAGAPATLDLPRDPSAQAQTVADVNQRTAQIPPRLAAAVERLARARQATPSMIYLAAYQAVLGRYAGAADLCVATAVANRATHELDAVVGCLMNTVVLRGRPEPGLRFAEFLERTREQLLGALEHGETPLEHVIEAVEPQRVPGRLPLAQALFLFQPPRPPQQRWGDAEAAELTVDYRPLALFEHSLVIEPSGAGLAARLVCGPRLWSPATAQRWLASYVAALEALVRQPDVTLAELPIPAAEERACLLHAWNATALDVPEETAFAAFDRQADAAPERVAVVDGEDAWTYGRLRETADRLAAALRKCGVQPGDLVGLHMQRSPLLLAGLLGVWKAGAAYVPLDPRYPAMRLQQMLDDAVPALILSDLPQPADLTVPDGRWQDPRALLTAAPSAARVAPANAAAAPAYVIYTSGSTGQPKGVVVPHRAVTNFLAAMQREPGIRPDDTVLGLTTISFDIAVLELLLPLTVGARVVLVPTATAGDGGELTRLIAAAQPTLIQATPATYRLLLAAGWRPAPGVKLLCGGEALDAALAGQLQAAGHELWNMYGPTETTVWSTVARVAPAEPATSIGRPIANTTCYVLDEQRRLVPAGVAGELYLGGRGVALGYYQRPELTAERFVPDPFAGDPAARMYRTGDRVRWLDDGRLEFLGRVDRQVKIRGYRIELGEVEAALLAHPGVHEAAALALQDASGELRLSAFYSAEAAPTVAELRAFLAERLPAQAIPSTWTRLAALPKTPGNKLDRNALLAQTSEAQEDVGYTPPRTSDERAVAEIWKELLQVQRIGVEEDFFELGGHSLLATQLAARIRATFQIDLPLRELFERPTIAGQAALIGQRRLSAHDPAVLAGLLERLESLSESEAASLLKLAAAAQENTSPAP